MSSLPPQMPMNPSPDDMSGLMPDAPIMAGADQPIEVRLKPGTPLHGKIVQKLRARLDLSYRNMSSRYDDWDRVDEHLRFHVDLTRTVRKGDKTTISGKREMPFDRAIVVPVSYAIHEVRKTQLFSLFGHRDPFLQLQGRGPEDQKAAKLLEAVLDYDYNESRGPVSLLAMLQDADRYGMGVVNDHWEDVSGWKTTQVAPPISPFMAPLVKMGLAQPPAPVPTRVWGTTKEYNRWSPVDPYNFWPDPRVSIANLQEGEFVGHRVYRGFMHLMERSVDQGGPYFNLDKLKTSSASGSQGETSRLVGRTRFNTDQFALKEMGDDKDKGYYTLDHLQVKLIPKDWELGGGDKPEIWWFTLADERTIIRAHKSAYEHGEFCYSVAETNADPHTIANPGVIENLDGLQRTINWLFNSHIENVRKFINNEMIFSPELIEEADMLNPGPARWIRLTQLGSQLVAQGTPINSMYSQLTAIDATKGHMDLVSGLFDMAQRLAGASDPAMGVPTDEQKTLGEVQAIAQGGSARMGVTARIIDAQAITPLANRAAANRQQFTSIEQYFRITGDLAKELSPSTTDPGLMQLIGAKDIQGNFDYVPHSAIASGDPSRMAQTYLSLLQTAAAFPIITQPQMPDGKKLDIREVFNKAAEESGIRDISEYYTVDQAFMQQVQMQQMQAQQQQAMAQGGGAIQVVPDQQFQQQVQAGNYTPA